jgi:hypothetical protein
MNKGSYIIEYVQVGNQVKATAIDPETGTEASIFGPASASKRDLSGLAVRKLLYMMHKDAAQDTDEDGTDTLA